MSKPRRIKKEDIGSPSNFVHVQHVGFGQKGPSGPTMASVSVSESERRPTLSSENTSANASQLGYDEQSFKVERRNKGIRQSQIPRHHRSTTTCIFPSENQYRSIETRESIDSPVPSSRNRSSLKPTFGSLLNLSFLPLGMGKSSSKSPSIGKAKRMSLLNLTASNLFAPTPKPSNEENRETVHMTGYTRRRSLSKEDNEDHIPSTLITKQNDDVFSSAIVNNPPPKPPRSNSNASSTRIPLAKLGRSKSSMAEFSKRPKLRLKIPPPPVAPPPAPPEVQRKNQTESEGLPSPPPSPLPSPPPSPLSPAMVEDVPLRNPKSVPRPRIIPLPSTSSVDSADPSSPQYLTPAGGCSPQPNNVESPFPVLSPTIPPSSTPFYSPSRNAPGTPPVWPLQPSWPSTISMQRKEASIPEVPSPCQEEMETSENEYTPVMSIVDSFLSGDHKGFEEQVESKTTETSPAEENEDQTTPDMVNNIAVTSSNLNVITSVLRETVTLAQWPSFAQKLFEGIHKDSSGCNSLTDREKDMYTSLLSKTLEMWSEVAGENAVVEKLFTILNEENLHQTTESLREILRNMRMSETKSE